ncbi:U6 snRNA phosphodiesterase [Cytospora mali]|uniref:U6 snRNA phosphodiesterase n=1 Tax=Cytospora mali TaxID=578113 RepID=A0A194V391_CYTMA|nr:U6 snRNA phosphodiesterase [Valsa mali var. pyri (nom. inval.)]
MALVEYSSSSDSEADSQEQQHRPCKRRRTSPPPLGSSSQPSSAREPPLPNPSSTGIRRDGTNTLPPLPSSFHDLYASTVRTATADLPSLHHGRKRVIPHKEGNWPSHIYTEWHPTTPQHSLLRSLLTSLDEALGPALAAQGGHELTGFLESGLGAPLPLHVSLSRPFVLRTGEKDGFLEDLVGEVQVCGVGAFELVCDGLSWHRSPDSERSFLVLRVRSSSSSTAATTTTTTAVNGGASRSGRNPELSTLLARCNDLVSSYGQPKLYAARHSSPQRQESDPGDKEEGTSSEGDAFHISIAWSFASPTDEIHRRTAEVFARPGFRDTVANDITIPVDGVKAKIGNVVTNIVLVGRKKGGKGRGLFGDV